MAKRITSAKVLGAVGCLVGGGWTYYLLILPALQIITAGRDWLDALLQFSMSLCFAIPGCALTVIGWRLLREEATRSRIKNACGLLAVPVAVILLLLQGYATRRFLAIDSHTVFIALLAPVAIAFLFYAMSAKAMLKASGITPVHGEFIGKGCYQFLAFLLWTSLISTASQIGLVFSTGTILDLAIILVLLLLPWYFYRLAVKYWVRDQREIFAEQFSLDYLGDRDGEQIKP